MANWRVTAASWSSAQPPMISAAQVAFRVCSWKGQGRGFPLGEPLLDITEGVLVGPVLLLPIQQVSGAPALRGGDGCQHIDLFLPALGEGRLDLDHTSFHVPYLGDQRLGCGLEHFKRQCMVFFLGCPVGWGRGAWLQGCLRRRLWLRTAFGVCWPSLRALPESRSGTCGNCPPNVDEELEVCHVARNHWVKGRSRSAWDRRERFPAVMLPLTLMVKTRRAGARGARIEKVA